MVLSESELMIGYREHTVKDGAGTEVIIKVDPVTEMTFQNLLEMVKGLGIEGMGLELMESLFLWGYEMGKGQGKLEAELDAHSREAATPKTINRVGIPAPPNLAVETFEEIVDSMKTQKQKDDIIRAKSRCSDWGAGCVYACPRVDLEKCPVPKRFPPKTAKKNAKEGGSR